MTQFKFPLATIASALILLPSPAKAEKKEIWFYTSIYKEFANPIKQGFEKANSDVKVNVFQAGSEKIQAKLESEFIAKKPQADVIAISDPFYLADLEKRGLLLKPASGQAVRYNYYSLMVLVCHKNVLAKDRPASFEDLKKGTFKGTLQMGSPLESGSMFTVVAYLKQKYGWGYFEALSQNELAATGGNSTVIQKVESGEKKCGISLLENVLAAQKRGSPVEAIYPTDGSLPIPSAQGILNASKQPAAAQKFADYLLSKEGQEQLRKGFMYSVRNDVNAPDKARPLAEVGKVGLWDNKFIQSVSAESKEIKKKFSRLILE